MERGNTKHSPLVDEEMEQETRSLEQGAPVSSRVEDHREVEPVELDDEAEAEDEAGADDEAEAEETEEGRS
jgi:hypothetical protein